MKLPLLLLALFFLSTNFIFSQDVTLKQPKKETYFDENGSRIGAVGFKIKYENYKTYAPSIVSETDSTIVHKIIFREVYDVLQPVERETVVKILQQLTGKTIDATKTIVINFFFFEHVQNQAPCIDHYTSDKKYLKYFDKHKSSIQFFLTEKGYSYNEANIFQDSKGTIRNLLFKDRMECGNYIIIKPNGQYYKRVGEYRQDEIPDRIKADW